MSAQDRAARIAALKAVLAITEKYPDIPLPEISTYSSDNVYWGLYGAESARRMALLEQALECELTASARKSGDRYRYELKGTLGDLAVTVSAPADLVAERKVTGSHTVEDVDWVRLPVEAGPESEDQ